MRDFRAGTPVTKPRLKDRVALVTGASRGGGKKGIALVLGEEGAVVYVTGRSVRDGGVCDPLACNRLSIACDGPTLVYLSGGAIRRVSGPQSFRVVDHAATVTALAAAGSQIAVADGYR